MTTAYLSFSIKDRRKSSGCLYATYAMFHLCTLLAYLWVEHALRQSSRTRRKPDVRMSSLAVFGSDPIRSTLTLHMGGTMPWDGVLERIKRRELNANIHCRHNETNCSCSCHGALPTTDDSPLNCELNKSFFSEGAAWQGFGHSNEKSNCAPGMNIPHSLSHLHVWCPVGSTVWEGLVEGSVPLEEGFDSSKTCAISSLLSLFHTLV